MAILSVDNALKFNDQPASFYISKNELFTISGRGSTTPANSILNGCTVTNVGGPSASYWYIHQTAYDANVAQFAISYSTNNTGLHTRFRFSGTWSPWLKHLTSADIADDVELKAAHQVSSARVVNWVWGRAVDAQNTANQAINIANTKVSKAGDAMTGYLQFYRGTVPRAHFEGDATGFVCHAYHPTGAWAGYWFRGVANGTTVVMNMHDINVGKVDATHGSFNGSIYASGIGMFSSKTYQVSLDGAVLNGISCGRLVCHSGNLVLHASNGQNWTYGGFYPIIHAAWNLGLPAWRWTQLVCVYHPDVSCDSKGKRLISNINFNETQPTKRSRATIPQSSILGFRNLIRNLEIREYHRLDLVKDPDVQPDVYRFQNEDGTYTYDEIPTYKQVLNPRKELGIFIDDLKDSPYFDFIGRVNVNEDTDEVSYSMDTGSYSTLGLIIGKDSMNRLDKMELANKKLRDILIAKQILSEEDIKNLTT